MDSEQLKRFREARTLSKQQAFIRLQANPDFRLLVHEMNAMAKSATRAQIETNPLTEPMKCMEYKLLATVLKKTIPERFESIINYKPESIDKQVEPIKRWSFKEWFKQFRSW